MKKTAKKSPTKITSGSVIQGRDFKFVGMELNADAVEVAKAAAQALAKVTESNAELARSNTAAAKALEALVNKFVAANIECLIKATDGGSIRFIGERAEMRT